MSIAEFSLVKKVPLEITRSSGGGKRINGVWVESPTETLTIQANVQPFSDYQTMLLPEGERTKNWLWVFSATNLFQRKEGSFPKEGDKFQWNGEWYLVMKTQTYQMSVRDHVEAKAARIELTPN